MIVSQPPAMASNRGLWPARRDLLHYCCTAGRRSPSLRLRGGGMGGFRGRLALFTSPMRLRNVFINPRKPPVNPTGNQVKSVLDY